MPKPSPAGRDSHNAPAMVLAQTEISSHELQVRDWDSDCINCGDDPVHYSAPEGSIASSAGAGAKRNTELRARVMALHRAGLRASMGVVYNRTTASGQTDKSVLGSALA